MSASVRDQAEGLRRLVNVRAVRCVGVLGPRDLDLDLVADALADAWQQRGRSVLVVELRPTSAAGRAGAPGVARAMPAAQDDLSGWLAALPSADVVLGLLDPMERAWPCLGFDEFVMVASGRPDHLTRAYAQLKTLSATSGRSSCHVLFSRTAESAALLPMQNIQQTARRFLGCVPEALGCMPDDAILHQSAQQGLSAVEAHPRAPAVRAIRLAVERLDSMAPRTTDWSAWLQRLTRAAGQAGRAPA
ncbi:MAG: MinD/ParA family protein [Rhodocyclaceae bacterium]|nr:MinD/ParA family protein [Rhodocyclaceae bacterium]